MCFEYYALSLIIKEAKSMSKQKFERGTNSVFDKGQELFRMFRCVHESNFDTIYL